MDIDPTSIGHERYAELTLAYSQAVQDRQLKISLESAGLRAVVDGGLNDLFDFSDFPPELGDKKDRMLEMRELRNAVLRLDIDWGEIEPKEFWRLLGGSDMPLSAKALIVEVLPRAPSEFRSALFGKLASTEQFLRGQLGDQAVTAWYDALRKWRNIGDLRFGGCNCHC